MFKIKNNMDDTIEILPDKSLRVKIVEYIMDIDIPTQQEIYDAIGDNLKSYRKYKEIALSKLSTGRRFVQLAEIKTYKKPLDGDLETFTFDLNWVKAELDSRSKWSNQCYSVPKDYIFTDKK
jgi:hypothetical protein